MAAVNAASAVAFASSVVHDAPVSGWRNEGIPWLRGAAARRSSDLCITYDAGDIRQWRAHVRSSLSRCALRAARTAAVKSRLVAATSPRAAASYGLRSNSRMEARRRLAADCTAGVNQLLEMPMTIRAPTQRRHCAASQHIHYCGGHPVNPVLVTRLRSLEIERGMRTGPQGKLILIPLLLLMQQFQSPCDPRGAFPRCGARTQAAKEEYWAVIRGKRLESRATRRMVPSNARWQGGQPRLAAAYPEDVIHHECAHIQGQPDTAVDVGADVVRPLKNSAPLSMQNCNNARPWAVTVVSPCRGEM